MFRYYFQLGLRSLRRNPVLTALMVLTLAVGVAASMATLTVLYVMSGDPIPHKSDRLFVPRLDNAPLQGYAEGDEPSDQMTYQDARNLLASGQGVRRTAVYTIGAGVESGRADLPPFVVQGQAPTRDFFAMFEVPMRYGAPWSAADEAAARDVVVLSRELSEKLFGNANPVGKSVRMDGNEWQVVGVSDTWQPRPRYYRLINGNGGSFTGNDELFIPFQAAIRHEMGNNGNTNCNGDGPSKPGFQVSATPVMGHSVWSKRTDLPTGLVPAPKIFSLSSRLITTTSRAAFSSATLQGAPYSIGTSNMAKKSRVGDTPSTRKGGRSRRPLSMPAPMPYSAVRRTPWLLASRLRASW